ncbi:nitrate regulatory gene2 protein [Senna tora]|uniref:Nitrate regulatory gene2 protein n=1 Tax=Senna tora TaxID=362788 RepID=A0A834SI35_9FABA|nr:nitrate regulatory gene2 protein [Senna tora]
MGCVLSSMDEEEKVRICKERKRLMKQLVDIRGEFSDSQLAYLMALRNTGATLRQFTESESLELDNYSDGVGLAGPSSPPLPLPPSPPPPPPLSPDKATGKVTQYESLEDVNNVDTLNPPFDYIFGPSLPYQRGLEIVEQEPVEEENWAETNTEFLDEDSEAEAVASGDVNSLSKKQDCREPVDDSRALSLCTKESMNMSMVVGRRSKSLESIVRELDECFLKASAGRKEIAVLIDISGGDTIPQQNSGHQKTKRSDSAKVFSVLSWSRHSKSSHYARDAAELSGPTEPCRPGAHCATLKKLYAAEKRLSKLLKEEEITKVEYERKSLLLQKQEDDNIEPIKIEKTRSSVENLESTVVSLRQSISETTSSILRLIDEELYPQLVALTSGLTQMWRTMYECHQAQTIISQQLNHLSGNQSTIENSEHHHQATRQLEAQVTYWYKSFCKLVKSQREYVRNLSKWMQLTDCLMDGHERSICAPMIRSISEQWELGLDKLPDKEASEAIKNLLSSIQCISVQQAEEYNLLKKVEKLDRKLQKELNSLEEMEQKMDWSSDAGDIPVNMSPNHPLSLKRAKTEALKKQMESEKAKYLNCVQVSQVMTLTNLKTRLPQVFHALMAFSNAYFQAIGIHSQVKPPECSDTAS